MKSVTCYFAFVWHVFQKGVNKIAWRQKWPLYAICIFCMIYMSSCFFHYYKVRSENGGDAAAIQKLVADYKYFILHTNGQNFELNNIKIESEIMEGEISPLPPEHEKYLHPKSKIQNRFPVQDINNVLLEVHIYTHEQTGGKSHVSIPVKNLYQVDVYELNEQATKRSKTLSIVGASLTVAGIILVIAAVSELNHEINNINYGTTGGCSPQVYALNKNKKDLAGILYSGAIFAPLQRTDYLPLAGVEPVDDNFHFQINGSENEELFIHEAKLMQVTHDKSEHVLIDHEGKIITYRQPVKPKKAFVGENRDVIKDVSVADGNYYSFTNQAAGQNSSDIILDFKKPINAHSGKLIVKAKNSMWGSYLFKKYKSLYGDYYQALLQQKDKADPKKLLQCELDQSLPLKVLVKENNAWKPVGYFFTPGNEMLRDMAMEIDLTDFKDANHLEIKLETTYMFWDLDFAGMDFSDDKPYQVNYVAADSLYIPGKKLNLEMPGSNIRLIEKESLNVDFSVKPTTTKDFVNSYFLVGDGYYHDNTKFEGKAQLTKIAAFSRKGAFDKFSRQTFDELLALMKGNTNSGVARNN